MMFVEMADAAGDDFYSSFYFISVQIYEESAVGEMIGRYGSEKMAVVVVFVMSMHGSFVKP